MGEGENIYGNDDVDPSPAVIKVCNQYKLNIIPFASKVIGQDQSECGEEVAACELAWHVIGTWCDGEYWRVFQSYKAFKLEEDFNPPEITI